MVFLIFSPNVTIFFPLFFLGGAEDEASMEWFPRAESPYFPFFPANFNFFLPSSLVPPFFVPPYHFPFAQDYWTNLEYFGRSRMSPFSEGDFFPNPDGKDLSSVSL